MGGYDPKISTFDRFLKAIDESLEMAGWDEARRQNFVNSEAAWFFDGFPKAPEDRWIIECTVVKEKYRRNKVFSKLMTEILRIGKEEKGFQKAQIRVFIGNDRAQKAYEKNGFVLNPSGTVL